MNKIINISAEKLDGAKSIALTKACLIIYFNEEQTLAFGVASKFQGGGSWGEYHIIGHSAGRGSTWQFSVGNFKPIDCDTEQFANTARQFKGFNIEKLEKYFEETDMDEIYDDFNFQLGWLDEDGNWNDVNFIPKEDHEFFEWDDGYPSEYSQYYESHLCSLQKMKDAEVNGNSLWYSKNDCDEELLKQLEKDDVIMRLSNMIPGNSQFSR
jgi:hypothetical protein